MDEEGVPLAFCPLLWRWNGGAVDDRGRPVVSPTWGSDHPGFVRGNCTAPSECIQCEVLAAELQFHPADEVTWVCPACAEKLVRRRHRIGLHLILAGYYATGFCQSPICTREGDNRESGFLQLVLGKIRRESG